MKFQQTVLIYNAAARQSMTKGECGRGSYTANEVCKTEKNVSYLENICTPWQYICSFLFLLSSKYN
jgi:hypothetical protein